MSPVHGITLGDVCRENARRFPGRTALICGSDHIAFDELDRRVDAVASALVASGLQRGDAVLWLGYNCHRIIELLFACAKTGLVFCAGNWRLTEGEVAMLLEDLSPRLVVWQPDVVAEAVSAAAASAEPGTRWVVHSRRSDDEFEQFVAEGDGKDPLRDPSPSAPLLAIFTAAHAGRPQAALLGHEALITSALLSGFTRNLSSEDIFLVSAPLSHMGGYLFILPLLVLGGASVMMPRVTAEDACALITEHRCTQAFLVGPTIDQVLALAKTDGYDLTSLRDLEVLGTPEWYGRLTGGYGQTQTTGPVISPAIGPSGQAGYGRSMPLTLVRILDEDGTELPTGETGEIAVRGPTVMEGYLNVLNLRENGGWWRTHDLGRRESDGSISFIGPKGRMIRSAAENIYPTEVEACIRRATGVTDVAVIGVPDETWQQSVKALVVTTTGQAGDADAIIEHCRSQMASYKKPRLVEFVEQIPRANGRIDYDALDAAYGGGGYPGGG